MSESPLERSDGDDDVISSLLAYFRASRKLFRRAIQLELHGKWGPQGLDLFVPNLKETLIKSAMSDLPRLSGDHYRSFILKDKRPSLSTRSIVIAARIVPKHVNYPERDVCDFRFRQKDLERIELEATCFDEASWSWVEYICRMLQSSYAPSDGSIGKWRVVDSSSAKGPDSNLAGESREGKTNMGRIGDKSANDGMMQMAPDRLEFRATALDVINWLEWESRHFDDPFATVIHLKELDRFYSLKVETFKLWESEEGDFDEKEPIDEVFIDILERPVGMVRIEMWHERAEGKDFYVELKNAMKDEFQENSDQSNNKASTGRQASPAGAPRLGAHDWAFQQEEAGKKKRWIYPEWEKRYIEEQLEGLEGLERSAAEKMIRDDDLNAKYDSAMSYRRRRK